jgi:hypothetical protein
MAPAKKPTSRRQRRNTPDLGLVVQATPQAALPPAERRWLHVTRERWEAFRSSDLVQVVEPATDTPALLRLFGYYDEIERAIRAVRRKRFVPGSHGQPRLNPATRYVAELEGAVRALEDRFGMTPRARLQLGVDFAAAQRSLRELNESVEVEDERDPRLESV